MEDYIYSSSSNLRFDADSSVTVGRGEFTKRLISSSSGSLLTIGSDRIDQQLRPVFMPGTAGQEWQVGT